MRAVVQRVHAARVEVAGEVVGSIGRGLCVFVAAGKGDADAPAVDYLADKISGLRVFEDADGKMNLSLADVGGEVLAVSQFTLYGDARKGRRPSFAQALAPPAAETIYDSFCAALRAPGHVVQTGRFRAEMRVVVDNDGPVTILIDSDRAF